MNRARVTNGRLYSYKRKRRKASGIMKAIRTDEKPQRNRIHREKHKSPCHPNSGSPGEVKAKSIVTR
jgi:hypothetical protein